MSINIIIQFLSRMQANINKKQQQKLLQNSIDFNKLEDETLSKLYTNLQQGCKKIYHEPGYMNSKGDAPYDFTCDDSHRCQKCRKLMIQIRDIRVERAKEQKDIENKGKVLVKLASKRNKYFKGKAGCKCTKQEMCKQCFDELQTIVTRLQKGCGKQWEQQFSGMAAGPGTVTCQDNYFLCEQCAEELAFIMKVNEEYPHVQLSHIQKKSCMFWSPTSWPYYNGLL